MSKKKLTLKNLIELAEKFCKQESTFENSELFGITDGKAVGTYIEHKFKQLLHKNYIVDTGSSAKGIDLPSKKY